MRIGILYDASNYYLSGQEKDFSLLSEVTKVKSGLENCSYETELIEGLGELLALLIQDSHKFDLFLNLITWTRSSKKMSPVELIDYFGIPYIGNSLKPLIICADKYITKLLAMELGIPVPKFIYENPYTLVPDNFQDIAQTLNVPFVMKANGTSGSLGLRLISNEVEYQQTRAEFKKKWNLGILYEEYIIGTDITVPIIETNKIASPLQTIKYLDSQGKDIPFFTREIKYYEDIEGITFDNDLKDSELVKKYALLIHNQVGCRLFSRSDFRLTPQGKFYFLECNASPDLNPHGAFVIASNMKYEQLLTHIITEALK